jgi:hypothetical protein
LATAQAAPDVEPLAAVSLMSTVDADTALTLALFAPSTRTAPADVLETVFCASSPVADVFPELAVVRPVGTGVPGSTVGASATDRPDWALALLVSVTLLECALATTSEPLPPLALPANNWVFVVADCACPAAAVALPLSALTADSGVAAAALDDGCLVSAD